MISKRARQARIVEIVRKARVTSQEELSVLLEQEGAAVTQSTLSRDIRELGLIKARGRYQTAGEGASASPVESARWAFQQFLLHTGLSGNMVMLKTSPGNAHSLGAALDAMEWPEVLGTVAGDDTIFVLLKNPRLGKKVLDRIGEYFS